MVGLPIYTTNRMISNYPSALDLSGWWRASYSTAPWVSTTSNGLSVGRQLVLGSEPGTGSSQGSFIPASFNGSTEFLASDITLDNYFNTSAYTVVMLVKPTNPAADAAAIYNNKQIISDDSGNFGISYSAVVSGDLRAWHFDNDWIQTPALAITNDSWMMVAATYANSTISLSVNVGTPVAVSAGSILGLGTIAMRVARNFSTTYTQEDVLEIMTAQRALNTSELIYIKTYFNNRYALML